MMNVQNKDEKKSMIFEYLSESNIKRSISFSKCYVLLYGKFKLES